MINLRTRSYKKELLDDPAIPFKDIRLNMQELNKINSMLGGHKITIEGIKQVVGQSPSAEEITVCEIGCGGGDNLYAISQWCNKKGIPAIFTGIDIKQACTDFARQQYPALPAEWISSDYKKAAFYGNKPTVIFSSLFCHHFTEDEIIKMLQWMKQNAQSGFFINDLHRHPAAYYSIKWITGLFSKSYLVKNDAPLSVARGFKKKEWKNLLSAAGILQYTIQWKWAFRYLIVCKNEQ